MKRSLLIAALALAVLGASGADAASAKVHKSACQRLKGGRDLAPGPNVKLKRHKNADRGTDLRGCVLPRGHVYTVASSDDFETTVDSYKLKQVARTIVAVSSTYSSQYAFSMTVSVWNLRSGKHYAVGVFCSPIEGGLCGPPDSATVPAVFINNKGQAVAALVPQVADPTKVIPTTVIAGFSSHGVKTTLDSAPSAAISADSLSLTGSTAYWTNSGTPRSALLTG